MTSNTLKAAFDHAILAQAAYVNLTDGLAGIPLKNELNAAGMTESMSQYIADHYEVYTSSINANLSGYQGIVFKEKNTDHYVLANRGTGSQANLAPNLIQDLIIDAILATTGTNPQTAKMVDLYDLIPTTATSITTTGHSLGGYLSTMALVKWEDAASKKIDFAYTYNGAGVESVFYINNFINLYNQLAGLPLTITLPNLNVNNFNTSDSFLKKMEEISNSKDNVISTKHIQRKEISMSLLKSILDKMSTVSRTQKKFT